MEFVIKTSFFKKLFSGILVVWFLLCILPGDCLLLGCTEESLSRCTEDNSVILPHCNEHTSVVLDDSHCSDCCVLCAHNIVLHITQYFPFTHMNPSGKDITQHTNRFKNIFLTIIFRPPRIIA
ncbi:MAG: hypothetical protein FJ264_17235 [Planctomycetes bacterium]|nr:hypothetical protein [Planctomycetota bacterium]